MISAFSLVSILILFWFRLKFVDLMQYQQAFLAMSLKFGLTESEVRKKFDECDLNRDGKITLTEMMTLYTKKLKVSDKKARVYVEVNN